MKETTKANKTTRSFVAYIDNISYFCIVKESFMANGTFDIVLLEEAELFLGTLAEKAREKVTSNYQEAMGRSPEGDCSCRRA